tara:strand:- start:158 stop:643 length:486 start_codon:yes stop_codon:yes gene_type:complete
MALVLKKWSANTSKDRRGNYVHIVGRDAGLVSWFMSVIGIDSVSEVEAKDQVILYKESSLAGFTRRIIPFSAVSSTFYGFHKPWREALLVSVLFLPFAGLGLILGPLYYFLNKQLVFGIVEFSGVSSGFAFKRSVIEGQKITEKDAERVIGILRALIEKQA